MRDDDEPGKPAHPDPASDMRMHTRTFHYYTMCDRKIASGEIMMDWASVFANLAALVPAEKFHERYEAGGLKGLIAGACKPS